MTTMQVACVGMKNEIDRHQTVLAWLAVVIFFVVALLGHFAVAADDKPAKKYSRGVLIKFNGEINRLREQYLYRKLAEARRQGADLVVIEVDSPGGYLHESENIAEHLRDLNWARTVAYIPDEAISGAAVISLGCDEIIMRPNASFGDAGVIFRDEFGHIRYAPEKIRSVVVELVRTLAEAKGRPPALAEAMVDMDLIVYRVRNRTTNKETFMSEAEIKSSPIREQLEKLEPVLESREKNFLTVKGERAVVLQLAQGTVDSREDLRGRYGLNEPFTVLEFGWIDATVVILNAPLVTGLLFVIGLIALYVEFSAPGISVGGLIAGLCFVLFFWSRFMGGTSDVLEVILFLCGIVFLAVELFVIPGFGVSGLTGILLIFISLVMAGQDFVIPSSRRDYSTLTVSLGVLVGSGTVFAIAAAVMTRYFGSLPVLNRLVLKPPTAVVSGSVEEASKGTILQPDDNFPVSVGDWGIADSALRPAGKARFGNDYVDVVTDGTFVDAGENVRVIDISGNRVMVRKVERTG